MNACLEHLPPPLAALLQELSRDHAFRDCLPELARCLRATDREADDKPDALTMMQVFSLIAAQPRPARDRFQDIAELINAKGRVTVTIKVAP